MPHKIVILGGGVAGMSAAHELAERGFEVEVFEQNTVAGGKARSVEVPGTAQGGRPGYPGEHGFRFFPRFYKHVTDTMKRIPFGDGDANVYGNLVGTSRTIEKDGETLQVAGDYYIAAFPVEVMAQFIRETPALCDNPNFASIVKLGCNVAWMNGAQFYLLDDVPICNGHVIYIDAPWALTSVSQHQFWPDVDLSQYGDGKVKGILSVDISEWGEPGSNGKAARDCTRDEIKAEVWAQLQRSLNTGGQMVLRDEDLHDWNLDSDIVFDEEHAAGELACHAPQTLSAQTSSSKTKNREPLLVNLINTWQLRPKSYTAIENLYLASDYVQTFTDLATMEGANEAARRATNAIIDAAGVSVAPCKLWQLHEPDILMPLRALDLVRYESGLPWKKPLGADAKALDMMGKLKQIL